jgi:hypothetical protein
MSDAWQLAESFERTRKLIAAINVISVHTKLTLAGAADPQSEDELSSAIGLVRAFLEKLAGDLPEFERDANSAVTGATARSNLLAKRFALARSQSPDASPIYAMPIRDFIPILSSSDKSDQIALISGLQALRNLLEEHHHADSSEMLGNL